MPPRLSAARLFAALRATRRRRCSPEAPHARPPLCRGCAGPTPPASRCELRSRPAARAAACPGPVALHPVEDVCPCETTRSACPPQNSSSGFGRGLRERTSQTRVEPANLTRARGGSGATLRLPPSAAPVRKGRCATPEVAAPKRRLRGANPRRRSRWRRKKCPRLFRYFHRLTAVAGAKRKLDRVDRSTYHRPSTYHRNALARALQLLIVYTIREGWRGRVARPTEGVTRARGLWSLLRKEESIWLLFQKDEVGRPGAPVGR